MPAANSKCYEALRKIGPHDIDRLYRRVMVRGPAQCWDWIGFKNDDGYGRMMLHGSSVSVHRVSYASAYGLPTIGLEIRHACNNESCVNPNHLVEGTHLENMRDRDATGWKPAMKFPGESNPMAKLTADSVVLIRKMRSETGLSYERIGRKFGISGSTVGLIIKRTTWSHI